jgi:hypothetical protein
MGAGASGAPGTGSSTPISYGGQPTSGSGYNGATLGGSNALKGGYYAEPSWDPGLTNAYSSFLQGQVGQGLPQFNGTVNLPTGGTTAPGQLSAPLTPQQQQLMAYFQSQLKNPQGLNNLQQMSNTGDPTDVGPAWQAMLKAQQQNISKNAAGIKEQFAFDGSLGGTSFGQSMGDFYSQTAADQNSLLAQMQMQSSEAAAGRKLSATDTLYGSLPAGVSGAEAFNQYAQWLNQNSINAYYNQFQTDLPQNNPLNQEMYGAAYSSPNMYNPGKGGGALGGLGGLLGSIGGDLTSIFAGIGL